MKIGLIRRGYSPTGGAEAYLLRLAAGLSAEGHEPVLIASKEWPDSRWPYGPVLRLNGATPSAFAAEFQAVKNSLDVSLSLERTPGCDVYRAGDGVHASWLRRRAVFEPGWRVFFRRWNPKHGALTLLERQVFNGCKMIIANSRMVAREIEEYFDISQEKIRVIPNGIGRPVQGIDRLDAKRKLGIDERKFCVLFAGSGWERKGLPFAVEAMKRLGDEFLLLVAGRGNAAGMSSPNVRFLGPTRDLAAIFSAADLFVLPTIYDPFSNACLEALASGLPVVTTTANGFSEIIEPGRHGTILEPGDVAGLAAAFQRWKSADMVVAAEDCRRLALLHTLEKNAQATLEVLKEVHASK